MFRFSSWGPQRRFISVQASPIWIWLFQKTQKKNERLKIELANERQIILELKAKMSDVGEVRSSNMELIDQLQKAKAAIEKLSAIRDRQKTQIDVSWPKYISHWQGQLANQQLI